MSDQFQLTEVGIPNTCSKCSEMQHVAWYAKNKDEARSGLGLCSKCAGIKPKTTRRKRTTSRSDENQIKKTI